MQTQVALDAIGPVVYGYHENPFEILGPHEIEDSGRRAMAVRAYLPEAQRAWVVDSAHGATRPMRRIHPAGLYEAVCPVDTNGNATERCRDSFSTVNDIFRATPPVEKESRPRGPLALEEFTKLHCGAESNRPKMNCSGGRPSITRGPRMLRSRDYS